MNIWECFIATILLRTRHIVKLKWEYLINIVKVYAIRKYTNFPPRLWIMKWDKKKENKQITMRVIWFHFNRNQCITCYDKMNKKWIIRRVYGCFIWLYHIADDSCPHYAHHIFPVLNSMEDIIIAVNCNNNNNKKTLQCSIKWCSRNLFILFFILESFFLPAFIANPISIYI